MIRQRLVMLFLAAAAVSILLSGSATAHREQARSAPVGTSPPRISGNLQVGQVLHAHPGHWSGATSFSYRWQRCNAHGKHCQLIEASKHRPYSKATYKLTSKDLGHRLQLGVTARNKWGHHTVWSRMTAKIARAGTGPLTLSPIAPGGPGSGGAGGSGGSGSGGGSGGGSGLPHIANGQSAGFDVACDAAPTTPFSDMTQDLLFSIQTTNGSALDLAGQCVSQLNVPAWVSAVHAHHELAFITIGGIADQNWQNACNNTNRAAFVTNLVNYMKNNGFDGIDLDIEDNAWAGQNAPVAAWDTCVQAISTAAHATATQAGTTPLVSEDVTTPWMGAYLKNDASYIDQFNLMTYGETVNQVASDVATTVSQGLPKNKMTVGIDLVDSGEPAGGCAPYAAWAQQQGLPGVMVWDIHSDSHNNTWPCFSQIGPYVAP